MAEAVDKVTGQECQIKWPNDIVLNRKKVCGILTEMNMELTVLLMLLLVLELMSTEWNLGKILRKRQLL